MLLSAASFSKVSSGEASSLFELKVAIGTFLLNTSVRCCRKSQPYFWQHKCTLTWFKANKNECMYTAEGGIFLCLSLM